MQALLCKAIKKAMKFLEPRGQSGVGVSSLFMSFFVAFVFLPNAIRPLSILFTHALKTTNLGHGQYVPIQQVTEWHSSL